MCAEVNPHIQINLGPRSQSRLTTAFSILHQVCLAAFRRFRGTELLHQCSIFKAQQPIKSLGLILSTITYECRHRKGEKGKSTQVESGEGCVRVAVAMQRVFLSSRLKTWTVLHGKQGQDTHRHTVWIFIKNMRPSTLELNGALIRIQLHLQKKALRKKYHLF